MGVGLARAHLDNLEKAGKIEISYHLICQPGNLLIAKVDSEEELTRIIGEDPSSSAAKEKLIPWQQEKITRNT